MASEKQQDWWARASSSHDAFMSQFEPLVGHLQSELALTKKMQDQLEASSSSTKRPSHATSMEEMVAVGDDGDTEPTSNPEEPDEPGVMQQAPTTPPGVPPCGRIRNPCWNGCMSGLNVLDVDLFDFELFCDLDKDRLKAVSSSLLWSTSIHRSRKALRRLRAKEAAIEAASSWTRICQFIQLKDLLRLEPVDRGTYRLANSFRKRETERLLQERRRSDGAVD